MGARNVRIALHVEPDKLSDRGRIVLVVMALHSLDRDYGDRPGSMYFGGRDLACATLGWYPDQASRRRFDRAVAELVRHGFVERERPAAGRRPAVYRLTLPVDNSTPDGPSR
jgi:hypothetical protein